MAQEILHPVKVATIVNITLSNGVMLDSENEDSKIDGVRLLVGDRILVKSQNDLTQNGIYEVSASQVSVGSFYHQLVRTSDFALASTHDATVVFIKRGDTLADTGFILATDTASGVVVGSDNISFKRFTVNDLSLNDVSSFLTLRSEKGYPLTNAELDNNFKYLGNALTNKVNQSEYTAVAIIDKINSLSFEEAGINSSLLRGMAPSILVPGTPPSLGTIVVRDPAGDVYADMFIGDLDGSADRLDGEHGSYYLNMDNAQAGTLSVARGGTDASTAAQARINLNVVNKSGDTLNGKLVFKPSETGIGGTASLKISPGEEVPTSTEDGDVWTSAAAIHYKLNGTTEKIAKVNSPTFTGDPRRDGTVYQLNTTDIKLLATVEFVNLARDDVQAQLNVKAPTESPTLTGAPAISSVMPSATDSSTRIPTTQWVKDSQTYLINNTIAATYETIANSNLKAPLSSPSFTGTPVITSAMPGITDSSNRIPTTQWVQGVASSILDSSIPNTYATINYVNTSARWQGSAKFVSANAPTSSDGQAGDVWIQI